MQQTITIFTIIFVQSQYNLSANVHSAILFWLVAIKEYSYVASKLAKFYYEGKLATLNHLIKTVVQQLLYCRADGKYILVRRLILRPFQ